MLELVNCENQDTVFLKYSLGVILAIVGLLGTCLQCIHHKVLRKDVCECSLRCLWTSKHQMCDFLPSYPRKRNPGWPLPLYCICIGINDTTGAFKNFNRWQL